MLYIVSTPIGNLGDMTYRAVDILKSVSLIVSEDTRRTGILLKHYDIKAKQISFNDYNKRNRIPIILNELEKNNVALVSDAGTPGISDPGYELVNACIDNNIEVSPVPGASAAVSALVSSGLATDRFTFIGFLPKKRSKKIEAIQLKGTIVAYESPHRIHKTLELFKEVRPDARLCIAREMTKKFEEFIRGTPDEILKMEKKMKGEIVLVYG